MKAMKGQEKEANLGDEVIGIYEDLLKTIWERILPTIGQVATTAIMRRALALTTKSHPLLNQVQITQKGFSFEQLRRNISEGDVKALQEAFKELVAHIIDILAMLTGNILTQHLEKELEKARARLRSQ